VLKLSDEELSEVAGACGVPLDPNPAVTLQALLTRRALDLVAMTRGAEGALLVTAGKTVDQPGIPTVVRDTVGAGDAFTAALAVGWLRGDGLPAIARRACEVASAVCAHAGAVPDQNL
jgi:fructokinase